MKTLRNFLGLAVCAFLFTSCATAGNPHLRQESEASVSVKIKEGVTTKDQIKDMFGSPDAITFTDGGLEIWKYFYIKTRATASTYVTALVGVTKEISNKKELVILFDQNNVVKRFTMSESTSELKSY